MKPPGENLSSNSLDQSFAAKHRQRGARRRSDSGPDVFQPFNRVSANTLAVSSVVSAIIGLTIGLVMHRVHWGGLIANNIAVLLAIAAVVLNRSRIAYSALIFAILALAASYFVPRWSQAWPIFS